MANSRIRLQPLSTFVNPNREVYVGWDEGLQTYYAQVFDGKDAQGEDRLTVDVGNGFGDVTYPGGVVTALRPYAEITDDLGELLNVSRVSTTPTYTDLRADSRIYQREQQVQSELNRLYRPDGFVTTLTRDDVAPVLSEHGWASSSIKATETGHTETYRRGEQELTIAWTWPDQDYDTERMLSPIHLDGQRHGVDKREELSSLLAEGSPDPRILTPGSEERVDELLTGILADDKAQNQDRRLDTGPDESWFDDPPSDDEGFHSGLGT